MKSKRPRSGERGVHIGLRTGKPANRRTGEPNRDVDLARLIHELQVHQVELEAQNDELRVARRESENAQRLYHELFESAPAGYLMLDTTGVIVRANLAACTLMAPARTVAGASIVGRGLGAFVESQDHDRLTEHLGSVRQHGRATCEVRLTRADSTRCVVRLDTSPIPSSAREFLVAITDMSERDRSQRTLERLNQELEAKNRQLRAEIEARGAAEAQQHELETRLRQAERLQSMGMLAAGVAHDFNNLLVGVVGNAEVLLSTPGLPEQYREPLTTMLRAGSSAADLTRQLLLLAGQGRMQMDEVSLHTMVSECLALLRESLSKDVQVHVRLERALPPIAADRAHVQRVVMNLIMNAVEAIQGVGQIVIDARIEQLDVEALACFHHASHARPGQFVVLRVEDTGHGIDSAALSRIFDPFFTTKFTGRGLGLAIALGVVQSHGGALRVSSQAGKGTRFDVAFPLWKSAMNAQHGELAIGPARSKPAPAEAWKASGPILVIDDDPTVLRVVARMMSRLGFEVTSVNGGREGLSQLRRAGGQFRLVVLDWLMPHMSGAEVLVELRQIAPQLPVILISGYSSEDLPTDGRRVVAVQKPMSIAQLGSAARKVLGVEDARASSSTTISDASASRIDFGAPKMPR